ncbi:MAG: Rieske 2Fe-2S domain-containing protein [Acidimicrobiales bacterium]
MGAWPAHERRSRGRPDAMLDNVDPSLRRCWHPVARSSEVGTGPVQVWLLGQAWALVRLDGQVRAFVDRCPHRGMPLSAGQVDGDRLRCAYHGWCYAADGRACEIPALGTGAVLPPRAVATAAAGVAERYGLVWIAPEPPVAPILEVAEAGDPAFRQGDLSPIRAAVGAGLMADNFLDFAHFPFVHAATFGAGESAEIGDFAVEAAEQGGFEVVYEHTFNNREDPGVEQGLRPLLQRRRMTYRYRVAFSMSLRLDFLDSGGSNVICLFVQPERQDSCRLYCSLWRDDVGGSHEAMAEMVSYEEKVLREDLAVQERYLDKRLPLDLTREVHTRADKATIELRRQLDALGSSG